MAWSGGSSFVADFPDDGWASYQQQQGDNNTSSGNVSIRDLSLGFNNTVIVGVVIAKEDPKAIASKKEPGTERHLLSFTIRDSPVDFINATCWGTEPHIQEMSATFHIGDVVEITNAQIASKPVDGSDERFRPWTPSMYQLNISERHSTVKLYGGWNIRNYDQLCNIPIKPSNDFYTLADVNANGQALHNEYINVLAVVKSVGSVRDITTKNGRHTKRCEVKIFDETCLSFPLILWDEEIIGLAQSWTSQDQVIFVADAKATFDTFRKAMTITATSKTIFTMNPDTREAHGLFRYAQTVDINDEDGSRGMENDNSVDIASIQDVFNIQQIKAKQKCSSPEGKTEYGITYAYITSLDIDADPGKVVTHRCCKCKFRINQDVGCCTNQNCPSGVDNNAETTEADSQFDIISTLSDHTGSLHSCHITGNVAERMLGCSVTEYLDYDDNTRTQLKWRLLLEKCKIYFKTILPSFDKPRAITRILSCEISDPQEAVRFLQ